MEWQWVGEPAGTCAQPRGALRTHKPSSHHTQNRPHAPPLSIFQHDHLSSCHSIKTHLTLAYTQISPPCFSPWNPEIRSSHLNECQSVTHRSGISGGSSVGTGARLAMCMLVCSTLCQPCGWLHFNEWVGYMSSETCHNAVARTTDSF